MSHYRTDDRAGACGGDRRAVWEEMAHDPNLLELAAAWRSEGRRVALATVVATWGSSPRPPGSQLLADDSGRFMGSVSGGCIEGEVVRRTPGADISAFADISAERFRHRPCI
jgi:hypothetical protein